MRLPARSVWFVLACTALPSATALADKLPPAPASAPATWSDPRVIDELTKSCSFDPDAMDKKHKAIWTGALEYGETSVMSCAVEEDQSCTYDPCFTAGEDRCKPRCVSTCRTCGKGCATACSACKKDCKDEACKRSCATTCATCHEACVRAGDHCATATCTAEYKTCRAKMKTDWHAKDCPSVCKPYGECVANCKSGTDIEVCMKRCKPRNTKGCDLGLCQGDFAMGVNPDERPDEMPEDNPPASAPASAP